MFTGLKSQRMPKIYGNQVNVMVSRSPILRGKGQVGLENVASSNFFPETLNTSFKKNR